MALYKYQNYLSVSKNNAFDLTFQPSAFVPCGGIFRCTGCGTEIALEGIGIFPDRAHHPHTPKQGPLGWQLVVATVSLLPQPYLHGS
ncbi:MAG TPA: hypothetical protein VGB65_05595 [Allosphingosinicella sp.]